MRPQRPNYLFSDYELSDSLRSSQTNIQEQVNGIQKDQFLGTPYDDLIDHLVSGNTIDPVVIYEDRMVASEPEECKVDVSGDRNRYIRDTSRPFYIDGHEIKIEIPFTGDRNLLRAKTNRWCSVFPVGQISFDSSGNNKIILTFQQAHDTDPNKIKSFLDENLNLIKKYVSWSKEQVSSHNALVPQLVKDAVDFRREKLKKQSSITDILGIPLKQKNGTPNFEPIKVKKRITKPLPPPPKGGFRPEPGITTDDYQTILKLIRHSGTSFEKTPKTFSVHGEEELRDFVLSQLNAVYEGKAKGETFNKSGKTDIIISDEGRNAFIAECKIWRGEKSFSEAIDQLLGYLTWRDCKTALVIFNKHNQDFSKILSQIELSVSSHGNYIKINNRIDENEWNFTMQAKDDVSRTIKMCVIIFNLYNSVS